MSSYVDERVVEMQFDNARFEKNAKSTIQTLGELEKSLDLKGSTKGLEQVQDAVKSVDFSYIEKGVDAITNKLSFMGVIGDQVLRSLADRFVRVAETWFMAIPKQAISGGKTRALNIEQAKFQLAGLGVEWADIYDNIDKAVSGTAYGLDEAAKIASQLAASGVAYGDAQSDMAHALRGISGVAAMTNSTYGEIGDIFATIAGQGKLMTFQLRQLESRGLNAAAQLGKVLGKSEQEIRDMVSKGQIDFAMFSKAMDEAFGEHATKANETFTGAFSNMKAAISRIGADFATPTLEALRKVFNALRETFNGIRKFTRPFAENQFTEWISKLSEFAVNIIGRLDFSWVGKLASNISSIVSSIIYFFDRGEKIVNAKELKYIQELGYDIEGLVKKARRPTKNLENLKKILAGLSAVVDIAKMAMSSIGTVLKKLAPYIRRVASKFLELGGIVGDYLVSLRDSIKANDTFNKTLRSIGAFLSVVRAKLFVAKNAIADFIRAFLKVEEGETSWSKFTSLLSLGVEKVKNTFESITKVLSASGGWKKLLDDIWNWFKGIWNKISPVLADFKEQVSGIFSGKGFGPKIFSYAGAFAALFVGARKWSATATSIRRYKDAFVSLFNVFKGVKVDIPGKLKWIFGEFQSPTNGISQNLGLAGTALRSFNDNLKIDSLKKIAAAILILAVGLTILAAIDGEKLGAALAATAAGIGLLVGAFKLLAIGNQASIKKWLATNSLYTNVIKLSVAILLISFSISVLAKAVERLSKIDTEKLLNGLIGILGLMAGIGGMILMLDGAKLKPSVGISLIAIAAAILILTRAVERLSGIDTDALVAGMIALLGIMTGLALMSQGLNSKSINPRVGIGIIAIAAGILILVEAVKRLGELEASGVLESGILSLAAIFSMIAVLGYALKDTKNIVGIGISMLLFAASMKILADVLASISEIKDIYTPLGAIAVILMMIMMFSKAVGDGVTGIMKTAVALMIFGIALLPFVQAMKVLSSLSWEGILKGLVAIAGGFLILGVAAAILAPLSTVIAVLALALLGIGAAVFMTSAGLMALATAMMTLAAAGTASASSLVAALSTLVTGIIGLAGLIGEGLALLVTGLIVTLAKSTDLIVRVIVDMVISVLGALAEAAPELVKNIAELLVNIFVSLGDYAPQIIEGALTMLDKVLAGLVTSLQNHAGNIFASVSEVLVWLIDGCLGIVADVFSTVADRAGEVLGALGGVIGEAIGGFIGGIVEGISEHFDEIAANMDVFLGALEPFLDHLNALNIDPDKIGALKTLGEAILVLTAAEIVDGLTKFASVFGGGAIGTLIGGGQKSTFAAFADEIAAMGPGIAKYSEAVSGIDSDAITSSAGAIKAIADVASKLGRTGGFISAALGKPVTLDQFASQMSAAVPGIKSFAQAAPDIAAAADDIEATAGVIDALVAVANKLNPQHEELLWGAFVRDAQGLGNFMSQFADVERNLKIPDALGGGELSTIDKGIGTILSEFSTSVKDVDTESLGKVSTILEQLAGVGQILQNNKESFSLFGAQIWTSETSSGLSEFINGLSVAAPNLKVISDAAGGADIQKINYMAYVLERLSAIETQFQDVGTPGFKITQFAANLKRAAENFADAGLLLQGVNTERVTSVVDMIDGMMDQVTEIGSTSVETLANSMKASAVMTSSSTANQVSETIASKLDRDTNIARYKSIGVNFVLGFVEGMRSQISQAESVAWNLSERTIQAMRRALHIASPSRVMQKLGGFTGEGFVKGLASWVDPAANTSDDLASSVAASAEATLDYLSQLLNGELVVSMTIRPVLDLTDVQSGAMAIDSMFTQRQAIAAQLDADALSQSDEVAELVDVSWKILREIQNGREIYLDGKVLAGSMNRRLGRMEGL